MDVSEDDNAMTGHEIPQGGDLTSGSGLDDKKLSEILGCPVCFKVPFPPIYGCHAGHIVCNSCKPRLKSCGVCRQPFGKGRNLVAESIVRAARFDCDYKENGCKETFYGDQIEEHMLKCKFGPGDPNTRKQRKLKLAGSGPISWVKVTSTNPLLPPNAVQGAEGPNGIKLYVARAPHEGGNIPGQFSSGTGKAHIPWGGMDHEKHEFEVLTAEEGALDWIPYYGGIVPRYAVPGGPSEDGEMLYIGRFPVHGDMQVGKIHRSHGGCFVSHGGVELSSQRYEVLVKADEYQSQSPYEPD